MVRISSFNRNNFRHLFFSLRCGSNTCYLGRNSKKIKKSCLNTSILYSIEVKPMSRKKLFFLLGIALTLVGYIFSYFQNKQISQISPIFQVSPNPSKILSEVEGQTSPISLITPIPSVFTIAKVTRVYDGDTIQIEGGQKVRYAGIDTPEVYPTVLCYS